MNNQAVFQQVLNNQAALLVATVTSQTLESHRAQLSKLPAAHTIPVALQLCVSASSVETEARSVQEQLFALLLPQWVEPLVLGQFAAVFALYAKHEKISTAAFVHKFHLDPVVGAILLNDPPQLSTLTRQLNVSSLPHAQLLVESCLEQPIPFADKVLLVSQALHTDSAPIHAFVTEMLQKTFRQLLLDVGPDNVLPDRLLPLLLQSDPDKLHENVALVVAEVIVPGSQNLAPGAGVTGLTFVNNLPEASAKGAQLGYAFAQLGAVEWLRVFAHAQLLLEEAAQRGAQPLMASVTQLLTALSHELGPIDAFLRCSWWFAKTLLYMLHLMHTQPGAFSLAQLDKLALCFPDEQSDLPLRFLSVARLEVHVLLLPSSDPKLETWLAQFFEMHCRTEPHHVIAGCADLATPFALAKIQPLFELVLDTDKARLVAERLDDAPRRLVEYCAARPTPESAAKALALCDAQQLLAAARPSYTLFWTLALEATNHGLELAPLVEQETRSNKPVVCNAVFEVLEARTAQDFERAQQRKPEPRALSVAVVFALLELLKSAQGAIDAARWKGMQLSVLTTYPRLINFDTGHNEAILENEKRWGNVFPPQVEQEMKGYYSRMYSKETEIKDIVEMLAWMKESNEAHAQDVFACMIHLLIDEYRFFAEYPLNALALTLLLFGALLQKDLIQGTTLTVALNFIWELCNQPHDLHLFKFAVQLLYNFKSRLHEYPKYCKHLLKCHSLLAHAKMYQIVLDALNGVPCHDARPDPETQYHALGAVRTPLAQEEPPELVLDRLLFFLNNMTQDTLESRFPEVEALLTDQYHAWFARYLVAERAQAEPNNHKMYAAFVERVHSGAFYEHVLGVTLAEIGRLLRALKDLATERAHLKNLGAWLGKITLGADRPLRRSHIAVKHLLVEAHDLGTLHIVIPLVCKIIDQASGSRVFRHPNPWTLGILQVLAELYVCAELKLNLKFEIEVLLNAFGLKMADVEPATLVRSHNPSPEAVAVLFGARPDPQSDVKMEPRPEPREEFLDASFSNLSGNTVFTQNPNLRRAFQALLARAVRECAVPILSRVSEAVLTTTEALVKKDFATEPDVARFRQGYQVLAQQLAHSMVVCSGRRILSELVEATMVQLLSSQVNPGELPLGELALAIQKNVGLCVEIVEKLAVSNMSELIEERMRPHVAARERHPPGTPFVDEGVWEYALHLPAPMGLQDGLMESQMRIYSAFGSQPPPQPQAQPQTQAPQTAPAPQPAPAQTQAPAAPGPAPAPVPQAPRLAGQGQVPGPQGPAQGPAPAQGAPGQVPGAPQVPAAGQGAQPLGVPAQVPAQGLQGPPGAAGPVDQLFTLITSFCERAMQLLTTVTETSLAELDLTHPISQAFAQVLLLCQSCLVKHPDLLLKVAQYAVNCLFTQSHDNPISTEIYVIILDKLCEYLPSTAKDVTWWMVHLADQRKFNMPVIFALLKVQLVQPLKLDLSIGKLIAESNNPALVEFALKLLVNVLAAEEGTRPVALRSEFACTLEALHKYAGESAAKDELFALLKTSSVPALPNAGSHTQMGYIFAEWVRLLGHAEDIALLQKAFIDGLYNAGILTVPERFEAFFKVATEVATTAYAAEEGVRSKTQRETYYLVDCLAILIVKLVVRFNPAHGDDAIEYLKNILSVVVVVLTADHEGGALCEQAHFRLLSLVFCAWSGELVLGDATAHLDEKFFLTMADVLATLQPLAYPGFTFSWISLVAHRMFLPRVLAHAAGHEAVCKLVCALQRFQGVYGSHESDVFQLVHKALTRLAVALVHDRPDFVAAFHYPLLKSCPAAYVQLRNIWSLAVQSGEPRFPASPADDLAKENLRKPVDSFLRIPAPALVRSIYAGLKLALPKESFGVSYDTVHYSTRLVHALVLHTGRAGAEERFAPTAPHVALLADLVAHGSVELAYHVASAVASNLRWDCALTTWFHSVLAHLFEKPPRAEMPDIVLRVLLERLLVPGPHPWGLTQAAAAVFKHASPASLAKVPEAKLLIEAVQSV